MKKKNALILGALLIIFVITFAVVYIVFSDNNNYNAEETTTETVNEEETEISRENMMHSYLTGEWVDNSIGMRKPVAYMLDNVPNAIPQTGISRAGVVYEAPVEGGICRLMPIIENYDDLELITNIRSARPYFPYFAQEFESIYLHSGDCIYSYEVTSSQTINNIKDDATASTGYNGITFFRGSDRYAPFNLYTSGEKINAGIEALNYEKLHSTDYSGKFLFAEDEEEVYLSDGIVAELVETNYRVNDSYFVYNSDEGIYYRYQYGEPHIDALNGEQLTTNNIILQYCDYNMFEFGGYLNIYVDGNGAGKYITNGKAIDITWEKNSEFGQTKYYDEDGNEVVMNQGKTWMCIILTDSINSLNISALN